ncbi:hypothetical protein PVL29_001638 [Vitis rotundifolia]|uniref:DUF7890 domain-containing protein n=1 Tax=Vitis rotundifolia TaxID=103349 RepID=A0AA39E3W1_VITRO|nr:hypothetical protein PVL29_001638 [Vitis rotundifolia]
MWGVFDKAVEFVRSSSDKSNLVFRDELSKTPLIRREEEMEERKKKKNGEGRGAAMRVKILMTREEAERLLSKCKDGGRLEFKDVVDEMMTIPANRVSVVNPETCRHDEVLKSIPEEC